MYYELGSERVNLGWLTLSVTNCFPSEGPFILKNNCLLIVFVFSQPFHRQYFKDFILLCFVSNFPFLYHMKFKFFKSFTQGTRKAKGYQFLFEISGRNKLKDNQHPSIYTPSFSCFLEGVHRLQETLLAVFSTDEL